MRHMAGCINFRPCPAATALGPNLRLGLTLAARAREEALRLGFDAVYTGMDEGSAVLRRRGWSVIGRSSSLRGPIAVFEKTLA